MSSIERRIEKAEETLSMNREPVIHRIVHFGQGPLPADERRDNGVVRHVRYTAIQERGKE